MEKLSVLLSVYKNDNAFNFRVAVESISLKQTTPPDEVVIIVDGPVSEELSDTVKIIEKEIPYVRVYRLSQNGGLGNAMRIGVNLCSYELIARMDADDIAAPDRFEKQRRFFEKNSEISIVGGQISEFIDDPDNIIGNREVPCEQEDLDLYTKSRCPFNHMTVMFKKADVLAVGNYQDWHYNEDYYLWIRMAEAGCKFANLPLTLVNVRVGKDMYARRGGWKYFKSEKGLQDYMLKKKMISIPRYVFNVAVRFVVQVAMPNSVRGLVFQKLFRK
ncbi:MAG: glycosyltransferase [Muribaculaceae bacterium]|nr:glycosyltransferase [Muribaculaceae bacterium]